MIESVLKLACKRKRTGRRKRSKPPPWTFTCSNLECPMFNRKRTTRKRAFRCRCGRVHHGSLRYLIM